MMWLGIHLEHGSVRSKPYTTGFHVEEYKGGDVFDDVAIAEEFCQFIANCDTCNPNVRGQPTMTARDRDSVSCQFRLKCIDEQITSGLLKQLKTHKATGMDGISSRLLKLTAPGVARSFLIIV